MRKGLFLERKNFFYISPFIDHRNEMVFVLRKMKDKISIFIDDNDGDRSILKVWFKGRRKATTRETSQTDFFCPLCYFKNNFSYSPSCFCALVKTN